MDIGLTLTRRTVLTGLAAPMIVGLPGRASPSEPSGRAQVSFVNDLPYLDTQAVGDLCAFPLTPTSHTPVSAEMQDWADCVL